MSPILHFQHGHGLIDMAVLELGDLGVGLRLSPYVLCAVSQMAVLKRLSPLQNRLIRSLV
jgi:hypothetical protein